MQARATVIPLVIASTMLASGCGEVSATSVDSGVSDTSDASADAGAENVGKVVYHPIVDGLERETIVYLPPADATTTDLPVVFVLHGTSQDGEKFFQDSRWREKADAEHFIAVFPTALYHCYGEDKNDDGDVDDAGETEIVTKWAAGKLGDPARLPLCTAAQLSAFPPAKQALADHPLADDVAFFDAMVDLLESHYSIDPKRIYTTGFSNGGTMSTRLGVERSNVIAALAASSGFVTFAGSSARPLDVIATLGARDDRFTEPFGIQEFPLRESLFTEYPMLEAVTIEPYLAMLQLEDTYVYDERILGGKKVISYTYSTSSVGATNTLTFLVLEDLTHEYADGTNYPVAYADGFWEAFATRSLP